MTLRTPIVATTVAVVVLATRALRAVAATPAERSATLPGDDLVPDAGVSMDRAADFDVAPDVVWPWLVQLGKGRGGWYFPRAVDALTPRGRRSLRALTPSLLDVHPGDDHPDWGPGEGILRVVSIDPERCLVYHSLRDRADGHRWPRDGRADRAGVMAMSWTLVLTPTPTGTRLHLRVRARASRVLGVLGDVFDGLTVALLVAGLRERLAS